MLPTVSFSIEVYSLTGQPDTNELPAPQIVGRTHFPDSFQVIGGDSRDPEAHLLTHLAAITSSRFQICPSSQQATMKPGISPITDPPPSQDPATTFSN